MPQEPQGAVNAWPWVRSTALTLRMSLRCGFATNAEQRDIKDIGMARCEYSADDGRNVRWSRAAYQPSCGVADVAVYQGMIKRLTYL